MPDHLTVPPGSTNTAAQVPITQTVHPAAAVALGWTPCASVRIVHWCGHGEELLPSPWGLLPVLDPETTPAL